MFPSVVTATHTHHLLWAGQNGLQPTPDNLHLGCSYHLHSSHCFLSTWGAVMLVTPQVERKKKRAGKTKPQCSYLPTIFTVSLRAWRDLVKFNSTAWSSNHWSTYGASAKAESCSTVTTQGQTFCHQWIRPTLTQKIFTGKLTILAWR